jgi:hypothetical protein
MGGIVLHTRKGRIVCSNTIDERLQLVYQEAIPEIRAMLFPSLIKPHEPHAEIEEEEDPNVKHHKRH